MDINELHTMMLDMAVTERRLPKAIRVQKQASWPDYPTEWMGYGWTLIGYLHAVLMAREQNSRRLILALSYSGVVRDSV